MIYVMIYQMYGQSMSDCFEVFQLSLPLCDSTWTTGYCKNVYCLLISWYFRPDWLGAGGLGIITFPSIHLDRRIEHQYIFHQSSGIDPMVTKFVVGWRIAILEEYMLATGPYRLSTGPTGFGLTTIATFHVHILTRLSCTRPRLIELISYFFNRYLGMTVSFVFR